MAGLEADPRVQARQATQLLEGRDALVDGLQLDEPSDVGAFLVAFAALKILLQHRSALRSVQCLKLLDNEGNARLFVRMYSRVPVMQVLDSNGNMTNQLFPEQMVYTEWENSGYASTRSCQDCHMPPAAGDVVISTRPMHGLPARPDFARHSFVGGNTYLLDILARNAQELNITATGFEQLIALDALQQAVHVGFDGVVFWNVLRGDHRLSLGRHGGLGGMRLCGREG